jgi:hypothetical protein
VLYTIAAAVYFARVGRLGAFVQGKLAAVAGLAGVRRKRAATQASRRATVADIDAQMERGWVSAKLREKRFDAAAVEDGVVRRDKTPQSS